MIPNATIDLKVDVSEFMVSWKKFEGDKIPRAIVLGFSHTAERGRDMIRFNTRAIFKLHTDYLIRGIMHIPEQNRVRYSGKKELRKSYLDNSQIDAATKALIGKYGDFQAAVFLRGANTPSRELGFMTPFEYGGYKLPHNRFNELSIPTKYMQTVSGFRDRKGAVSYQWQPATLLEYYNVMGPNKTGARSKYASSKKTPQAFLLKSKFGDYKMIAKRTGQDRKSMKILYRFFDFASIGARWNFVNTVHNTARMYIYFDVENEIKKIKSDTGKGYY